MEHLPCDSQAAPRRGLPTRPTGSATPRAAGTASAGGQSRGVGREGMDEWSGEKKGLNRLVFEVVQEVKERETERKKRNNWRKTKDEENKEKENESKKDRSKVPGIRFVMNRFSNPGCVCSCA